MNKDRTIDSLSDLDKFRLFDSVVKSNYDKYGLVDLGNMQFDGENSSEIYTRICSAKEIIHEWEYTQFKLLDEFHFISKDIKYLTGLTHFFRPHIVDVSKGTEYHQTAEDRRYMVFCSLVLQAIYNYWDRIGDLLWRYFETGLKERDVDFSRVMNKIPDEFKECDYFNGLNSLYQDHVKPVLKLRREVVHYYQLEVNYYYSFIEHYEDKSKLQELHNERMSFSEKYSEQLSLCNDAFKLALDLINELPDKERK